MGELSAISAPEPDVMPSTPSTLAGPVVGQTGHLPVAGWYSDPQGPTGGLRFWDGSRWTMRTKE
ncbi:MAG: DUF2510 domain-containing protein [Actinomycetia bacterium]|nr:DUF2510 domain-containing protein [Actinomycetes bacterium]